MAILYDSTARKWNVTYEKTDHPMLSTDNTTTKTIYVNTVLTPGNSKGQFAVETITDISLTPAPFYDPVVIDRNSTPASILSQTNAVAWGTPTYDLDVKPLQAQLAADDIQLNELHKKENEKITALNTSNASKNTAYNNTVAVANNSKGGDYVTQRAIIRNSQGIDAQTLQTLEDNFKAFYSTEKLQKWDIALGAQPPYGSFDPTYYKTQNPTASQQWSAAVANDDIDIIQRYDENTFYLQHYTSQGKPAGLRGNAAEEPTAAKLYIETKPTDADIQAVRSYQLSVDTASQSARLLKVPEIAAEWEKAKNNDPHWSQLAKQYYLNPTKEDEFAALFRLSQREQDKQIAFKYNVNAGYGVTELEDALTVATGEKAIVDVKKFGALTQNVLKDTIEEMKKAKANEELLGMLGGFGSFQEITNINQELSNALLGDSGIGGLLSFTSGGKGKESLEKGLQDITGIRNSAVYNWQQWFDTSLKEKYNKDVELGYSTDQAKGTIKIEAQFAKDFIDKYLVPRFDTSKSMNEFVDYLDVKQSEQNPFQTQDLLDATKLIADLRANAYIDQLKATSDRYFNSEFYFNPTGNKAKEAEYLAQTTNVNADWEKAKAGDTYWTSQAYRFGVDVKDKDAFARMHFQIKGQGQGYDGADDILNASKVSSQIYDVILPALKEEVLKQGTIFGQFIKPEEFADEMLKGVDPANQAGWQEVLNKYGLTDFKGDITGLKEYIVQSIQTGSAQDIRAQIKYLNEKRQRPTQELLGSTYIERPEDYTGTGTGTKPGEETELFKVFQSAGYKGTEDEFYTNFFPDVDRSEQAALTKAGAGGVFEITGLDFNDPIASLGKIESFLADEEEAPAEETSASSSFFDLGLNDGEEGYTKTKSGSQILGEFTSMFKGL